MTSPIRVYGIAGSPFVRRVQMVLEEKGVPYENIVLSRDKGELRTDEHLARSPRGKVPAMTDGDVSIYESQAIVEYLEERHPEPTLVPGDPAGRAAMRTEELEAMLYFAPALGTVAVRKFMTPKAEQNPAAIADAVEAMAQEVDGAEKRAAARGGDYILGGEMTRADLSWLAMVEIAERAGMKLDDGRFPWLSAWRERMRARPSYDATYPAGWR